MDTLDVLLDEDAWSELTAVRHLEILQVVADLEQYRLGIPYALKVQEGIMEDCGGYYANEYHQIVLKADLVAERSASVRKNWCGYDDKNYFSRVFKKVEGRPPGSHIDIA